MSLSAAIAKGVNAAFKGVGDLAVAVTVITYDQATSSRHDTTGLVSFSGSTTYTGQIIVAAFKRIEGRANVEADDLRGIMKQSEILILRIADLVTFGGGNYSVIGIEPDPSNSVWDCRLRRRSA